MKKGDTSKFLSDWTANKKESDALYHSEQINKEETHIIKEEPVLKPAPVNHPIEPYDNSNKPMLIKYLNMGADALSISVKQLTNYICFGAVICVMLGIGQSYIT